MNDVLEPIPRAAPIPYQGPDAWRASIGRALREVIDPELALTIVDLGLVYGVRASGDAVHVRLTMTSAACPVVDVIVAALEEALDRALPSGIAIDVEVTWDPPWSPERMSERAWRCMNA
jgi:metal-sulfur cluster biosynthetic enzyme